MAAQRLPPRVGEMGWPGMGEEQGKGGNAENKALARDGTTETGDGKGWQGKPKPGTIHTALNRAAIAFPNQKGRRSPQGEKQSMLWSLRRTDFKKTTRKREMCLKF